eukprot:2861996-Prymnesium_polylepis.1
MRRARFTPASSGDVSASRKMASCWCAARQRRMAYARIGDGFGARRRLCLGGVRTEGLDRAEARAAAAAAAEARALGHVRLH